MSEIVAYQCDCCKKIMTNEEYSHASDEMDKNEILNMIDENYVFCAVCQKNFKTSFCNALKDINHKQ